MLPLLLKDGLLLPYVVTSLGFLFFALYLLSALDRATVDTLRIGPYVRLYGTCFPRMNIPLLVKWKVSGSSVTDVETPTSDVLIPVTKL